ncbi:MAG: hypothetical protein KF805_02720 [Phycisphaeraceae bacterium]|nr:hypothetical protein [Phycisphaeraceae bacterium]
MRAKKWTQKTVMVGAIGLVASSTLAGPRKFDLTGEIPISVPSNKAFINLKGWVAAQSTTGPVLWKNGSLQSVPGKAGRTWTGVTGINDFGDVCGTYTETGSSTARAWAWNNAQLIDGPTGPVWMSNSATGINNRRELGVFVVPFTVVDCGNGSTQWYGKGGFGKSGVWKSAGPWSQECTSACTIYSSVAYSINNASDLLVNGFGSQARSGGGCSLMNSYYVYSSGGTATPVADVYYSSIPTMNDLGQVLSNATWIEGGVTKVGIQLWSNGVGAKIYTFGTLIPGMTVPSGPLRLNSLGQLIATNVGYPTGYYEDGKWYDLRTLVSLPSNVTISLLLDINDAGQIVASGKRAGAPRLFVLTQRPYCPADLNGDGFVDDLDYPLFTQAYNASTCPTPPTECPGDLNADGIVDDADFVLFLISYNLTVCN